MFESLYFFFRGAIGFSLIVAGLSFVLSPKRERSLHAFGALFAAIGALFTWSALDPVLRFQVDVDTFFYLILLYVVSQSFLEIALFLFGNERHKGQKRKAYIVGAACYGALFILSFLDYLFSRATEVRSIEDSLVRGPIHEAVSLAAYAWPIGVIVIALRIARWQPSDVSQAYPETRRLIHGLRYIAFLLLLALFAMLMEFRLLYRIAHLSLELSLLVGYFLIIRHPDTFLRVRAQIGREHARKFTLSKEDSAKIHAALLAFVSDPTILGDEDLDLPMLAERIGVPSYRLSHYFNAKLSTTFSTWMNTQRIAYVRKRMLERPDLGILEIALEAGYKSKTTFNTQFARIVGMSPSEYRGRGEKRGK